MQNFLSACIILPLLLFFPMQFALQTVNHHNIMQFQSIVEAAKETAKQDGYFTQENIQNMKNEISEEFEDIEEGEIIVTVTTAPRYRTDVFDVRELISYEVGVPVKELIAAPGLWGLGKNEMIYRVSGSVASERLAGM